MLYNYNLNEQVITNIIHLKKVGDRSLGRLEGSLFNSYYTEMQGRVLLLSLDYSTVPLIRNLYSLCVKLGDIKYHF